MRNFIKQGDGKRYSWIAITGLVLLVLAMSYFVIQSRSTSGISQEKVTAYVNTYFNEPDASDRIKDEGFAYYVDTQPRAYLDSKDSSKMTDGNGPLVIVKSSGKVYKFSSNPSDLDIYSNTSEAGFEKALKEAQYPVEPIATIQ